MKMWQKRISLILAVIVVVVAVLFLKLGNKECCLCSSFRYHAPCLIDLKTGEPVIANKMGGFSGDAIFPVAVRMVYQVANAVNIPVIGMGGVSSAEDVIEMMLAGATAVEVGAANLVNPYACRDIINDLPRVMAKYGIENLADIIGAVK